MAEYTQAQIDEVMRQLNAGAVTVEQLSQTYGVDASEIQANADAINASTGYVTPVYDPALLDIFQDTTAPSYMGDLIEGVINHDFGPIDVTDNIISSIDENSGGNSIPAPAPYTPPEIDDSEGTNEIVDTKMAMLQDAIHSIINSGLSQEEMVPQVAQLLRDAGLSSDAVAQASDFSLDDINAALSSQGFDTRGILTPLTPAEQAAQDAAAAKEADDRTLVQKIGSGVGEAIDSIFETLGLPNPTKVIGAPNTSTGTVVWGPSGGSPVINTGTTGAGTQTGVTTGNAALDAILNKVTGVITGRIEAGEAITPAIAREVLVAQTMAETDMTEEEVEVLIERGPVTDSPEDTINDWLNPDPKTTSTDQPMGDDNIQTGYVLDTDGNPTDPFTGGEPSPDDNPIDPTGDPTPTPIGGGGSGSGFLRGMTDEMFPEFTPQFSNNDPKLLDRLYRL